MELMLILIILEIICCLTLLVLLYIERAKNKSEYEKLPQSVDTKITFTNRPGIFINHSIKANTKYPGLNDDVMILNITLNGNINITSSQFVNQNFTDYLTSLLNGVIIYTTEEITNILYQGVNYIGIKTSKSNEFELYVNSINGEDNILKDKIIQKIKEPSLTEKISIIKDSSINSNIEDDIYEIDKDNEELINYIDDNIIKKNEEITDLILSDKDLIEDYSS